MSNTPGFAMDLEHQTAVVTGASGELGSRIANTLARKGARLVLPYQEEWRPTPVLDWLAEREVEHLAFPADVTNPDQVRSLFFEAQNRFGTIDILVNCVGTPSDRTKVEDTEVEAWERTMNLNLRSVFVCCRAAIPWMKEQGRGRIINIAARPGVVPEAGSGPLAAAKAGLIQLTRVIAEENKKFNISANVILPSVLDTPASRKAHPKSKPQLWVDPEDAAKVALFLVSDHGRAVNGSVLELPGQLPQ